MSKPQQILHVIGELDGYGLTRQLELLVEQQVADGHKVRVVALTAKPHAVQSIERLNIRCRPLNQRWRRDPFLAMRLAREFRQSSFDILHLWGQTAVHYARTIQRFISAQPMLASLRTKTVIGTRSTGNISPGISPLETPTTSRARFLAEQKLPDNALLIAVAGPLTRQQQIDEAIWYFELIRTLDKRVRLLVFGDGPDRHRLERFSRLTSEPSAIRFLGYRSDFRELLPHVDLFWQTAATDRGLSMSLLEAMAARVPVVANDGANARSVIDDGDNGYLVPDRDRAGYARQSRKILHDRELAEKMKTDAAAAIANRFPVEAMTQAYSELYSELLGR